MPQNGFHGLAGLGIARLAAGMAPAEAAVPFTAWTVLGAMLPDVDMYPTAIAFLAGRMDLIYVIHRSLTHSLPFVLLIFAAGVCFRRIGVRFALFGLGVGVLSHILLDTLLWFTQIDVFWPFSHWHNSGWEAPVVNLWAGAKMDPLFINIRESFEYFAFALLLGALNRITGDSALRKWIAFCWVYFGVTLTTAVVFAAKPSIQNIIVTTPYLLLLLPVCWLAVWRNRVPLTRWALGSPAAAKERS